MTTRRGSSHVRPRPPSSGRRQPVKVAAPDRRRVREHRGIDARRRRPPLATRTLLALSIVILAAVAFVAASGGVGPVLSSLGSTIGSAFGRLTATPQPSATEVIATDSPSIASPAQPYTNIKTIDLSVSIPAEVVGDPTAKVRLYLTLAGLQAAPVVDVPVGTTSRMSIPFELTAGRNDISATLFRGGEESDQSPIVTYILDQDPPKITITSPKNGAAVDAPDVSVKGTTQANTSLVVLNAGNGTSISVIAAKDGTFEFGLSLGPGTNDITITGTDPAGNVGTAKLKLIQGSAKMTVRLSASSYRISVAKRPASIQLVALVTDPSGAPLAGASAFFTLQIPGLAPISNSLVTGSDGRAVFTTPLVGSLTTGGGLGTVLVTSDVYGTSTSRVTLTFVK
ncbi:MAG: hypothetical protein HYX55_09325 [Chloroflexi bacterium]|nr:hypothetical protein [Chloroflexota bacterium]